MLNSAKAADLSFSARANPGSALSRKRPSFIVLCWILVAITLGCMAYHGPVGWDTAVYWKAMQSLHNGSDPYAEGIAAQDAFHNQPFHSLNAHSPFTYVYSPLTLPVLRWLSMLPAGPVALLYGLALTLGFLLQLWAGFQMSAKLERRRLVLLLPFVVFFPGLLCNDVILSGNFAYILYGAVLAAAVPGWKRDNWSWYYIAVLAASVIKAPLLTLLAFPILVGRRQWIPAGMTGTAGLLLFAASAQLWPVLFREYMRAIYLQFEWNHDFGFSPSGLLGRALEGMGKPYSRASTIFYLIFAGSIGFLLLYLSRRVRQGYLSRETWIPVALVGTILLNPRIKEYDLAAITVPMLLLAWRALRRWPEPRGISARHGSARARVAVAAGWFVAVNIIAAIANTEWETRLPDAWRWMAMMLMLAIFAAGAWGLLKEAESGSLLRPTSLNLS